MEGLLHHLEPQSELTLILKDYEAIRAQIVLSNKLSLKFLKEGSFIEYTALCLHDQIQKMKGVPINSCQLIDCQLSCVPTQGKVSWAISQGHAFFPVLESLSAPNLCLKVTAPVPAIFSGLVS